MDAEASKEFRAKRGLTQRGLADLLGVEQATISRVEGGKQRASRPLQRLFERILDEDRGGRIGRRPT
jgi:transcriptional regulator with XRE-family HTH domain